jgi:hypothetical protein
MELVMLLIENCDYVPMQESALQLRQELCRDLQTEFCYLHNNKRFILEPTPPQPVVTTAASSGTWQFHQSPQQPAGLFCENISIVLPAFLSSSVWRKHQYSLEDISDTLATFPSTHLCSLALAENLLQNTTRRTQHPGTLIANKDRLLHHFAAADWLGHHSVLHRQRHVPFKFVPPLPQHLLPLEIWQMACSGVPRFQDDCNVFCQLRLEYDCIFFWPLYCSLYVPYSREAENVVLMKRVIPLTTFKQIYAQLRERPVIVWYGQEPLAVLEEAFLMSPG